MIPLARPIIGADERAAVDAVLASGSLVQGEVVAAFEQELGAMVEGRHCVAVSSGTSALHLGLLAAGIGPGDEVIVPSFTFAATANAVRLAGAEPVFADIRADTFCISPDSIRERIGPRTAAVMPVHLFGQPAEMEAISALATRHGLLLVEDAAQAHSASYLGRAAGAWGQVAAFSFYATKNMTTGEGGLIVTPDPAIARTCRLLRHQGMERRYHNEIVGFNARMTDVAAAIGRAQLRRLDAWTERRRSTAAWYDAALADAPVRTPTVAPAARHVYHQYTLRSARRDELAAGLADRGVASAVFYPVPVHELPAYRQRLDLPETARAAAEVLSIPVGPHLSDAEIARVIEAVHRG